MISRCLQGVLPDAPWSWRLRAPAYRPTDRLTDSGDLRWSEALYAAGKVAVRRETYV